MNIIEKKIWDLEEFIGFSIERKEITLDSNSPHDEFFSYSVCLKFYNDPINLKKAIILNEDILILLSKNDFKDKRLTALLFSLLGDMYYILGDFTRSLGAFMKSLTYNRVDMTSWVGLMFSLRALDKIDIFEKIMFNLEFFINSWNKSDEKEFNQDILIRLIQKFD